MTSKLNLVLTALLLCTANGVVFAIGDEAITDPMHAGPDFLIQGEYQGKLKKDGKDARVGVQIVARGDGKFDGVLYSDGLPGDGWTREKNQEKFKGETKDGVTKFAGTFGTAEIKDGKLVVANSGGEKLGMLDRVERKSPTLGAKPPAGAVVLFDGTNVDHFPGAKMDGDHQLKVPARTKDIYQDFHMHLEFLLPYMPRSTGQARANSGVFLQNRYEVQILDSFGLDGANNECGALYAVEPPKVNMCLPPLVWQTYDVDFTGARFDGEKKVKNARITLEHNGVKVFDDYEILKQPPAPEEMSEFPGKGIFVIQDHGNPVVLRNIWVVVKKP